MDGKLFLKGALSGHVNHIFAEAIVVKFFMHVGYVMSQHKGDKYP